MLLAKVRRLLTPLSALNCRVPRLVGLTNAKVQVSQDATVCLRACVMKPYTLNRPWKRHDTCCASHVNLEVTSGLLCHTNNNLGNVVIARCSSQVAHGRHVLSQSRLPIH